MVTHQLQVERRTGKVRQSETDVYHCAMPPCAYLERFRDFVAFHPHPVYLAQLIPVALLHRALLFSRDIQLAPKTVDNPVLLSQFRVHCFAAFLDFRALGLHSFEFVQSVDVTLLGLVPFFARSIQLVAQSVSEYFLP